MPPISGVLFGNLKYSDLGEVSIRFDDGSSETRDIESLGTTVFASSGVRKPLSVSLLGGTYELENFPGEITFPNGERGTLYHFAFEGGPTIIMADIY